MKKKHSILGIILIIAAAGAGALGYQHYQLDQARSCFERYETYDERSIDMLTDDAVFLIHYPDGQLQRWDFGQPAKRQWLRETTKQLQQNPPPFQIDYTDYSITKSTDGFFSVKGTALRSDTNQKTGTFNYTLLLSEGHCQIAGGSFHEAASTNAP